MPPLLALEFTPILVPTTLAMLATPEKRSLTTSPRSLLGLSAWAEGVAAWEVSTAFALEGATGLGDSFLGSGVGLATAEEGFFCSAVGVAFAAAAAAEEEAKTELQLTSSHLTSLRS
jgi:hypothetical protein